MRTKLLAAFFVIVLVGALAACGDDDVSVAPGSPTTAPPPELDGRTFIARAVTEDGAPYELVAGTEVRISFAAGTIGASAGCNSLGADYTIDGSVLRVEPMSTTEIGCDGPRHDQDAWLVAFLTDGPVVTLVGDELTLESPTTTMVLLDREVADPDRPLVGTTWVLDTVLDGDTASSVPTDEHLSLTIADGVLTAALPCNDFSASVDIGDGQIIRVTEGTATAVGCADDALQELELHMIRTLTGSIAFDIQADVLTLTNGSFGLGYRAATE